jgi:FMN-dependent oxidoreductase (nitrilotriacetate monooxygenase family)
VKKLHLGVFESNRISHLTQGIWAHPEQQKKHRYKDLDYWIEIAQILERGKFDFMFFTDSLGYPTSKTDFAFREATFLPGLDPKALIPALAAVTKHIGFAVTSSTTYEEPYPHARRFSTLDHLLKGRISWNIVTTSNTSAADLYGRTNNVPHDERYDIADEYMDICYKLWEGSYEDDAVRVDSANHIFIDPDKAHLIKHEGKYYKFTGYHYCEPSIQRTPVLFQAGSSTRGRKFAARHAEAVFLKAPSLEVMREHVKEIRKTAQEYGREPNHIKIFNGLSVVVAPTEEEAKRKYKDYLSYQNEEATLDSYAGISGVDLRTLDPDSLFENIHSERGQTHTERYTKYNPNPLTVREVMNDFLDKGFRGPVFVGTPEQVADKIQHWVEETDIDGFNVEPYIHPASYLDFVDLVVPELQRRGVFRTEYEETTLRERLFGKGITRLPDQHPGAAFRHIHSPL